MARNDPLSFRPDDDIEERFHDFKTNIGAKKGKALNRLVDRGLQSYGYHHSKTNAAQLKRGINEAAKGVTYTSLAVFGITAWTTLNLAFVASLFLLGGMALYHIASSDIPHTLARIFYEDDASTNDAEGAEVTANGD